MAKNKTDEEIKKELQEQESTNYLRKAPKALQNVIRNSFVAGIVLLIISVILVFTELTIGMVIPPALLGIIAIVTGINIRNSAINGTYKTFKGTVVSCEYPIALKTRTKAVVFASEGKRYKITYNRHKLKIGDIVTVYAPSSVFVYERNGIYNINSYYAVNIEKT